MFPFQRGLVHAYWSPNLWALYCFADLLLAFILRKFLKIPLEHKSTLTSGIVQQTQFDVLPEIKPALTIILILAFSIPLWIKVLRQPNKQFLFLYASLQMFIFYMFGFHVHEKAILLPFGIYQIYSISNSSKAKYSLLFSFVSGIGLLPLLPEHAETGLKLIGLAFYHLIYWTYLKYSAYSNKDSTLLSLNIYEKTIIAVGCVVTIYGNIIAPLITNNQQASFFPLMLHSVYCALLNVWFFFSMYLEVIRIQKNNEISQDLSKKTQKQHKL